MSSDRLVRTIAIFSFSVDQRLCYAQMAQFRLIQNLRNKTWSIRSSVDSNRFDQSPSSRTRLIKAIQSFQVKLSSKIQEIRKDLPKKLFFFLAGFYCATAFSTVIGQTGDWDVLSAGFAVLLVEVIGALMYRASLPLLGKVRNLITVFNYWKTGLSLGLFLDSFKY